MLEIISFILHIDSYLDTFILNFGAFVYSILFSIIFIETGLVIIPFLPGDSLLFAAGAFASRGSLSLFLLLISLSIAAILGDSLNYWFGHSIGRKAFQKNWPFLNYNHLYKTEEFYEKHGGKTIIIARFLPFIRTFAPFVAGIGKMPYPKFLSYNVIGGLLWVFLFVLAGFFFGNIPFIRDNFSWAVIAIIFASVLPMIYHYFLNFAKRISSRR